MAIDLPSYMQDIFDSEKGDRGEGSATWNAANDIPSVADNIRDSIEDDDDYYANDQNVAKTASAISSVAKKASSISSAAKSAQTAGTLPSAATATIATSIPIKTLTKDIPTTPISQGIAKTIPSVTENLKEAMAKEVVNLLEWEEAKGTTTVGTLAQREEKIASKTQGAWTVEKITALTTPSVKIDINGLYKTVATPQTQAIPTRYNEYWNNVIEAASKAEGGFLGELDRVVNQFEDAELRTIAIADQVAEMGTYHVLTLLATLRDPTATSEARLAATTRLQAMGVPPAELTNLTGDALNGKIYELLANSVINNYGLQDRYIAFGSPNAIYSTAKMDWALFGRAATATLAPSTMALTGKIDWTSEIRRDLEEKYGKQLSQEYINRLATDFPFLAMNLFAGKTDIDGVNDFMSKFNSVTYEQHEIGLQMYDERLKWANLVATGKQMGLTDDECYAVLQMVRDSYSDQDRAKFDEWMLSGSFENDMKIAATLLDPLGGIAPLTRDPELQSSVMAGTMIAGALAGFAMGGPAGAVMGGLMGVFAGSEPFNLFNTNVFAQRELDKAKNFGIADPASDLKAFEDRSRDLQQLYKAHLERGDLDAAHKIALSGIELTNQIAEWALENKYALQQAGVLDMIRQDVANSHERWEASTIGDSLERDFVSRKLELPPEFTPGKDIMTLDGVEIPGLESRIVTLPPGEYEIGYSIGGMMPAYVKVTTSEWNIPMARAGITDPEYPIPLKYLSETVPGTTTLTEAKTIREARAQEIARTGTLTVPISLPEGWKWYDENSKEWKSGGSIVLDGYNRTYITIIDDKGFERYTSIDPSTEIVPMDLKITTSVPYAKDENGQSKIISNAFTKQHGEGMGGITINPFIEIGATIYIDGVKYAGGEQAVLPAGDHVIEVRRPGYEPEVKTVTVKEGIEETLTMIPKSKDQSQAVAKSEFYGYAYSPDTGKYTWYKDTVGLVQIDPSLPAEWKYTVDGKSVDVGKTYQLQPGTHSIIVERPGYEPELKTLTVKAGETYVTGEIPTYQKKEESKVTGGGGGGGGGGSGLPYTPTTYSTTAQTTVSFGNVVNGCSVTYDQVEIEPTVDTKYETEPGYHTVVIVCPNNKGIEKQVYAVAKQNTHINPTLEDLPEEPTEPIEPEEPDEDEEEEEEVLVFWVSFSTEPQGAKVLLNGVFIGEWTPCRVPLEMGLYLLSFYKSGYLGPSTWLWVDDEVLYGDDAVAAATDAGVEIPEVVT